MDAPRRADEPCRSIPEFDVYEMPDGRWRAVHRADADLVIEHAAWTELFMACVSARIRRVIQEAADELWERRAAAGGRTRPPGPLGGLNG